MSKLKVTQIKSTVGRPHPHRRVIAALGLRHHQMTVIHEDTPTIRGMLQKVRHLVRVEEVK
ncbi:MAG TPA: 50S ribosomal protein L30 [Candidatus Krumholzibacteria bacterium]|nr:50S ribosomal protein L30 [Candidatus Krumholzibacteria bacterium]HPD72072.1 50S ribosomal protein L30 [Candidatus Krumholzibacteria bacterium]HRY40996.1 50S ribosomal protein L30 [Candidatus Krumholzibacteria bacterium]